jgi:serine/threonine protein kinase
MSLRDLQVATNNFNQELLLGIGSFGSVYKDEFEELPLVPENGSRSSGKVDLAVKRLDPESFQGYDEWLAEVRILSNLRHPNLVRLLGYCAENGEALLAYELCPHGALNWVLFSDRNEDLLSWEQRVKVALDVARGLAYLHGNNLIHEAFQHSASPGHDCDIDGFWNGQGWAPRGRHP